jgi:predicted NAD-dependent protein-ADP-ribosyltransferase YbiA (DUF1768 family)
VWATRSIRPLPGRRGREIIPFNMPDRIDRFVGEHAFLSNFYPVAVSFEGDVYPTVERAFQAAKTLDPAERAQVRGAKTPGSAKTLGRKVKLRLDWETVKVGIMLDLLRIKFTHPVLGKALLDTGDAWSRLHSCIASIAPGRARLPAGLG